MNDLCDFIANYLGVAEVKPETGMKDLVKDSLEFIDLMIEIQTKFEATIPDNVFQNFKTVEDIGKVLFAVPA